MIICKSEEMKTPSSTIKYVVHHAGKMFFSEFNRIAELVRRDYAPETVDFAHCDANYSTIFKQHYYFITFKKNNLQLVLSRL